MFKKVVIYIVCHLIFVSLSIASHHDDTSHHAHHTQHVALFAGLTFNLHTEENSPTIGADWEYRLPILDHKVGVGLITDLVFAEATEFIVAPAVFFHPFAGLKFLVAPGLVFIEDHEEEDAHNEVSHMHSAPLLAEVEDDHNESPLMVRLGIAYDIHLGKASITPVLNADLIHEHWSLAGGLALGFGF